MKTLKFNLFFLLSITCSSTVFAQTYQAAADKILGIYWSPKKDAKIEIYKTGSHYFGKSIWVASPRQDTENPDPSLRSRQVLGIDLLRNFIYEDEGYTQGKVYDPESGKTYDCKMKLNGDYLKIRGYIGLSLFGRTEVFKRIN
ncbi:DUF2147 domain-containing protein [Inquilinus sp. KBS0705]|nr:DUF2147 domain-containing protein [Inquilinus sp. KBS0705]